MIGKVAYSWILLLACKAGGVANAADTPIVRLSAGKDLLWIYRNMPVDSPVQVHEFAYRRAGVSAHGTFVPLPLPPLRGDVVRQAVVGRDLHVFFGDGTHRRYVPIDMEWNNRATHLQNPERSLPLGAVPIAVAGDESADLLYAVSTPRVAAEVLSAMHTPNAEQPSAEIDTTMEPVKTPPSDDLAVLRYDRPSWAYDRSLPHDVAADQVVALLARHGELHLFSRSEGAHRRIQHRISHKPDEPWGDPTVPPVEKNDVILQVVFVADQPTLLYGRHRQAGLIVSAVQYVDDTWQSAFTLLSDEGLPVEFSAPPAVTVFRDAVAVVESIPGGRLYTGLWSLTTGKILAEMQPLTLFNRPWRAHGNTMLEFVLQYGVLGAVLAALLFWRRECFIRSPSGATTPGIARLDLRLKALIVDMAVLAPVWLPLVVWLWFRDGHGLTLAERVAIQPDSWLERVFSGWAVVGAIFGLYGFFAEALRNATLGKHLLGLQVVAEDGGQCAIRAILIRNILRIVEFQFPPLAVFVVLTPKRQRVGDLFARTLVVAPSRESVSQTPQTDTGD